jgi:hypothetical protein
MGIWDNPLDRLVCRRRHFSTADEARSHALLHHHRGAYIAKCDRCEKGWYKTVKPTPFTQPVLRERRMDLVKGRNSCFQKRQYPSEQIARQVIVSRAFCGRAYLCTLCGAWHITKTAVKENPP